MDISNVSNSAQQGINTKATVESSVKDQRVQGAVVDSQQVKEELVDTVRETQVVVEPEQLEELANHLNEFMDSLQRGVHFKLHEDTGRTMVQVVDPSTDEVLREFPSEEMLDLAFRISESTGKILNEKA